MSSRIPSIANALTQPGLTATNGAFKTGKGLHESKSPVIDNTTRQLLSISTIPLIIANAPYATNKFKMAAGNGVIPQFFNFLPDLAKSNTYFVTKTLLSPLSVFAATGILFSQLSKNDTSKTSIVMTGSGLLLAALSMPIDLFKHPSVDPKLFSKELGLHRNITAMKNIQGIAAMLLLAAHSSESLFPNHENRYQNKI